MVKRVAIFGAESTGKSTLAARLGARFQAPVVPEFVRGFWDARAGKIGAGDLDAIARGQMESEDRAVPEAAAVLICDTELLTNVLWADLLFPGHCPPWVRAEAERRCRLYSLYLLCDTDRPFVPDPQRCFPAPEDRAKCRKLWRETLTRRQLPLVDIQGDWVTRERVAIAAVAALGL